MARSRRARLQDVHALAGGLPGVTCLDGRVYQVRRKSFVFFRNPRPDALDSETGERLTDVIVFWVPSLEEKEAMVADASTPYFTTPHFDGHLSVLLRGSRVGEISHEELTEVVTEAWLSRAPKRMAQAFLDAGPGQRSDV
jgi:hypothetical protein